MYLPQNISHLAEKHRIKKTELAKVLGVTATQVSAYSNGKSYPRIEGLIELAKYFDVNMHDLVLIDLSTEEARSFESTEAREASADEQLTLMNRLLSDRVLLLEQQMKIDNPKLAKDLGIE